MNIALNAKKERISASQAESQDCFYCPVCGAKVMLKRGQVRHPYFSHQQNVLCSDDYSSEMSAWHYEWQDQFPPENQEIIFADHGETHRADVSVGKIILEFQESPLAIDEFQRRNRFYAGVGKTILWLFDASSSAPQGSFREWTDLPSDFVYWSHIRSCLQKFCSGEETIPYVFLETSHEPQTIDWIRANPLPEYQHGFVRIARFSRERFLNFVQVLALPGEPLSQVASRKVWLSSEIGDFFWRKRISFCPLSPDGAASLHSCLTCSFRGAKKGQFNYECLFPLPLELPLFFFQPKTLFSYVNNRGICDRLGNYEFYSIEDLRFVRHLSLPLSRDDLYLYGDIFFRGEDGSLYPANNERVEGANAPLWLPLALRDENHRH